MKKVAILVLFFLSFAVSALAVEIENEVEVKYAVSPTNKKLVAKIDKASLNALQTFISEEGGKEGSFYQVTYSDRNLPTVYFDEVTDVQSFSLFWSPDGKCLLSTLRRYATTCKFGDNCDPYAEKSKIQFFSIYDIQKNIVHIACGYNPNWVKDKKNTLNYISTPNRANGYKEEIMNIAMADFPVDGLIMNRGEKGSFFPVFSKFSTSFFNALAVRDSKKLNELVKMFSDGDKKTIDSFLKQVVPKTKTPFSCKNFNINTEASSFNCKLEKRNSRISFGYKISKITPSEIELKVYNADFLPEEGCMH